MSKAEVLGIFVSTRIRGHGSEGVARGVVAVQRKTVPTSLWAAGNEGKADEATSQSRMPISVVLCRSVRVRHTTSHTEALVTIQYGLPAYER